MKKFIALSLVAVALLASCDTTSKEQQDNAEALANASQQELQQAVNDRDQLLQLVNEISSGMDEVKRLENILTVTNGISDETQGQRQQIQADLAAIQQALQERREKLEALEKKLQGSSLTNSNLRKTIETLRTQIDSQSNEITALKNNLSEANMRIGQLDAAVDSLNTTVSTVTEEKDKAEQQTVDLANELNQCYYCIGSKSELKNHNIIETGFLRKTKLMKGDFDRNYFTTADKRTLTHIALHSDKAEVLTNQPKNSYTIEEVDGQKVLKITDADLFWSLSNYLVIKID